MKVSVMRVIVSMRLPQPPSRAATGDRILNLDPIAQMLLPLQAGVPDWLAYDTIVVNKHQVLDDKLVEDADIVLVVIVAAGAVVIMSVPGMNTSSWMFWPTHSYVTHDVICHNGVQHNKCPDD